MSKHRLRPFKVGNLSIGEGRGVGEPSAVIEIEDNNGGFLTSRLTTAEIAAIPNPAEGLMVWNTDTKAIQVFKELGGWESVNGGGGGPSATAATGINVTPTGNLASTTVQDALVELQTDIDGITVPSSIDDLSDVDTATTTPSNNDVLSWDGSNFVPVAPTTVPSSIDDLSDVDTTTTTPSNNDVLSWNGSNFVPVAPVTVPDEVVENSGALSGAAPTGAQFGIDTATGATYYVNGGNWTAVPTTTVDLNITVSSESGNNSGAAPLSAPASPDNGDIHLEVYDDNLVWWSYNGSTWTSTAQVAAPTQMIGASSTVAGSAGSVPAPSAGDNGKFLKGDGTWGSVSQSIMVGATSTSPGSAGSVPAPATGDQDKFLNGNGTWVSVTPAVFDGASSTVAGSAGSVLAPAAGDENKFLRGDQSWQTLGITEVLDYNDDIVGTKLINVPRLSRFSIDSTDNVNIGKTTFRDGIVTHESNVGPANPLVFTRFNSFAGSFSTEVSRSNFKTDRYHTFFQIVDNVIRRSDNATNSTTMDNTGYQLQITFGDFKVNGSAGTSGQVLQSNGPNNAPSWATPAAPAAFTGASSTVAGSAGSVLAPAAGDEGKFLKGDGSWGDVDTLSLNATEATSATTAVVGEILMVNTTGGAVAITPPASPNTGDRFAVTDSRGNASTNAIAINFAAASQPLHGASDNYIINEDRVTMEFIYANATVGWLLNK